MVSAVMLSFIEDSYYHQYTSVPGDGTAAYVYVAHKQQTVCVAHDCVLFVVNAYSANRVAMKHTQLLLPF